MSMLVLMLHTYLCHPAAASQARAEPALVVAVSERTNTRRCSDLQGYIRKVTVQNNLAVAVEASIKPGSPERYSVQPSSFRLAAGSSTSISVHLKVVKFAQKQKAAAQGQRDIFHVKVRIWLFAFQCLRY